MGQLRVFNCISFSKVGQSQTGTLDIASEHLRFSIRVHNNLPFYITFKSTQLRFGGLVRCHKKGKK